MTLPDPYAAITRYLKKQHVLTLACQADGELWCASCYYVCDPASAVLWIMSDVQTRHGTLLLRQPQVAGTVSGQPKSVARIKGVQFAGAARPLAGAAEQQARAAYVRRFPIAARQSATLWEIRLSELKMTDNTLGFGTKLVWQAAQ
ncbi:YhbP family protein [Pantoea sp. 1.19]|uniref:YhbP family protein n=1 Tax=Pantoea sp. 1.19 TaxID=1925589 RepID=UPI000948E86B|nr:YhbP family protein [Pantoea sp. 1.19]